MVTPWTSPSTLIRTATRYQRSPFQQVKERAGGFHLGHDEARIGGPGLGRLHSASGML